MALASAARSEALDCLDPESKANVWSSILALSCGPERSNFCYVDSEVTHIIFDFDGTLTATPGEHATRKGKVDELIERAPMLEPRLQKLRDNGYVLGIMSKSTETTVLGALEEAGLRDYFNGPTVFKAVGLEGKAGIIQNMLLEGAYAPLTENDLYQILLVDDDVYELERSRDRGLQTYSAPANGGLQEADFTSIFVGLLLEDPPDGFIPEKLATVMSGRCLGDLVFPNTQRIVRVWTAGITGNSLGLDQKETQHVNLETGIGPLYSNLYEVQEVIGKGGFSVIASGRHIATDKQVALKAVLKKDAGSQYYDNFVKRDVCHFILKMTAEAPHPNVIHYWDYLEGDQYLFGTMEVLTGQDLSVFLQEREEPITSSLIQHLTQQALSGLQHFHTVLDKGLIHRDVKLENLQFRSASPTSELVLVDVGLSCPATPKEKRQVVGTLLYTAPEVFTQHYSTQIDIWSLGVVCYIMFTGRPPWIQDRRTFKDRKVIDEGHVQRALGTADVKRLPPSGVDLLSKMLFIDPDQRLTAAGALEHPWVSVSMGEIRREMSMEVISRCGSPLAATAENYGIVRRMSKGATYQWDQTSFAPSDGKS